MSPGGALLLALASAAALAAAWLAAEGLHRRPDVGAFALFAWLAASVAFPEHPEWFQRTIAGINVTVPDVLCAFLGAVAGLRALRGMVRVRAEVRWPLLAVAAFLVLSFLRGAVVFGLQHATNEFREFFYFLTALAFSASFPFGRLGWRLPGVAVAGGCLLGMVAVVHLAATRRFDLAHRPLPSYAALAIGEAFFLGWFWLRERPRSWPCHALVLTFLPLAFFMLHRSVWMCLLAGLAGLLALDGRGRRRLLATLAFAGLAVTAAVVLFFRAQAARGLEGAVEETSSQNSTFMWRVEGWTALLASDSQLSLVDLAVGRPMGSGYARTLGDSVTNAPEISAGVIPHNYYVSMLLRGGVLGLASFLALYAAVLGCLFAARRREPGGVYAPAFIVVLFVQLVYYVPYSADFLQGLLLGGAVALAAAPRSVRIFPLLACASPS